VGAPVCGDVMKLQIRVDEYSKICDVRSKTFGRDSAITSSSFMTELVRGLTLQEVGMVGGTEVAQGSLIPTCQNVFIAMGSGLITVHCSMLAEDAIISVVPGFHNKRNKRGARTGLNAPNMGPESPATLGTMYNEYYA
jgi:iron-sulfur cluster assembly enzyme ISCU, mitochondrial